MTRAIIMLAIMLGCSGCTSPPGPIAAKVCIRSAISTKKSNEIRDFILSESEANDLSKYDFTNQARDVTRNANIVLVKIQSRPVLPTFRAMIEINPTHGGSVVVVYGYDPGIPPGMRSIMNGLENDFAFSSVEPLSSERGGGCPADEAPSKSPSQTSDGLGGVNPKFTAGAG